MTRALAAGIGWLLLCSLLLLAACGPAATPGPTARLVASTSTAPASPPETVASTPSLGTRQNATAPTLVPPDPEDLLAWTVAPDGTVYVLDRAQGLTHLATESLAPLARSSTLPEVAAEAPTYLLAGEKYIFVGSATLSQTLVLDRTDLSLVTRLEGYGPLALEASQRLFMIPQGLEETWPTYNFEVRAYDLQDLSGPPDRVRRTGASFADLRTDPARRRLYALMSNILASPPHQGQQYAVYDLDTLEEVAVFDWERGSLTPPVINPRTGDIMGSRVGLDGSRRFLILNPQGQEVRNLPAADGQVATDPAGDWIYLLRQRGLWVLREKDLALQSVLPFAQAPPQDLALSPDGQTLYLFGNGWLSALSTADLRSQGIVPVSPLPATWFAGQPPAGYAQARFYPSPQMEDDGLAFVQLEGQVGNVLETYYTTDGGRSWRLLASLVDPGLAGARLHSLSPDFARDTTLTAFSGSTLLRSGDGGLSWESWQPRIAFSSDRDGDREIYAMDLEGKGVQRLTDSPAAEENPAWSPAWTWLAFQSDRSGNWDIFAVRAGCDASHPESEPGCDWQQLTDDPADDLLPAWSPDGRTIAFVSTRDGNPEIYVMDHDGRNQRRLTFHPAGDWRPAWLPDSKHLVFVSDRGGDNDIYQLAVPPPDAAPLAPEPEPRPVIVSPADDRDPATGPGGRMVFLSDRDGTMRTYAATIGDPYSQPMALTATDQPEGHPATLPGEYYTILVSSERDGSPTIYRATFSDYRPLAPSTGYDGQPAAEATGWQPDLQASLAWIEEQGP